MSTRSGRARLADPLNEVALVARARRAALIGAHRHRLSREDLEDCYSQATLELLIGARRGRTFSSTRHIANAIELRFVSRIHDRRRAASGRSGAQAALARSVRFGAYPEEEPVDPRLDVEALVQTRLELLRVIAAASALTGDQRTVLVSQLQGISAAGLCARECWSPEKYRKVAQRARARLRALSSVPLHDAPSEEMAGTHL